ncbi:Subversion of eukaryotic traffic protein A [Aquicella siphonis]|uniref:Subversion of eukaryotic traffic protein A n=1 Tax=Aquicella siphonis TaxID=254247 RepID=A0A5E4PJX7_9COXI|nr:glycosyltransferase [Aquicella siphonis]VVC76671.1 Subversion of eukaryotic traffic protein A [Aquicella siphonis]
MPEQGMKNVVNWARANPEFKVKIWIDAQSDPDYAAKYDRLKSELFPHEWPDNIEFADINQTGIISDEIRYEINSLAPNYGASSDMLRYNILFQEGGAYFDCMDVNPSEKNRLGDVKFPASDDLDPDKNVFDTPLQDHRFLMHITSHSILTGRREAPGSEAMVCTPGNPKMQMLAEKAREAYHHNSAWTYKNLRYGDSGAASAVSPASPSTLPSSPALFSRTSAAPGPLRQPAMKNPLLSRVKRSAVETVRKEEGPEIQRQKAEEIRAKNTLSATGPGMVISALETGTPGRVPPEYLMPHDPMRSQDWVSLPKHHAGSWGAIRITPHIRDEAMHIALESIYYEAKEMRIFNLSWHVEQIYQSCKKFLPPLSDEKTIREEIRQELSTNIRSDNRFDRLIEAQMNGTLSLRAQPQDEPHPKGLST